MSTISFFINLIFRGSFTPTYANSSAVREVISDFKPAIYLSKPNSLRKAAYLFHSMSPFRMRDRKIHYYIYVLRFYRAGVKVCCPTADQYEIK